MPRLAVLAVLLALAPDHAEIAFVNDGRIWASRADGSERRALVRGSEPAWSPDGSRLAYVSGDRLMLLGHGPVTSPRKGASDQSPAWSPDGTAVAFWRFSAEGEQYLSSIVVRDLAGGTERVLVTKRVFPRFNFVTTPAWSPDGRTIAYTQLRIDSKHDIRPDIRTIPAAGGASRLLIRDAQMPAWSPDGSRLAFASVRDRNGKRCSSDECWFAGELYTAGSDGGGLRRLTRNEGDDAVPRWSPDGSRILFTSDRNLPEGDSNEVYSVAADGTCLTWLTNGAPSSAFPTWRVGTGSRFDPGSCDPATRAPLIGTQAPPPTWRGLWLGPRYGELLFSRVEHRIAHYDDCVRFDRCPATISMYPEPACRRISYRGIEHHSLRRVRGALFTYSRETTSAHVYSGDAITSVTLSRGGLADVRRVLRSLRPPDASRPPRRLAPPRVPRAVARRLGITRYRPC